MVNNVTKPAPKSWERVRGVEALLDSGGVTERGLDECDGVEAAFQAYPLKRYLRTERVQLSARLYGEFYHAEGARREIRNEYVKDIGYAVLAWLYDHDVD